MKRILTLLLFLTPLLPGALAAAGLEFSASVDRTAVGLGDPFTLQLTVNGENLSSVPRPELPALPDFDLLGQTQSSSTSIQIVNGQMRKQATVTFIYTLSAKQLGSATISACRLTYAGTEYRSQPIEITVVKSSPAPAAPRQRAPGLPAQESGIQVDGNVLLAASVDRRTVYVGEQVTISYELLSRFTIDQVGRLIPSYGGFWSENVADPLASRQLGFDRRTVDGKAFLAGLVRKDALFPMSDGELTVKPQELEVAVAVQRSLFDFGSSRAVKARSKPLSITVLPLPEGKPAAFSGGVGQFSVSSSLDRTATSNSEPLTLTIKLSGTGNIRLVEKPVIPPVPGLQILDPEVKEDIRSSGGVIKGTRTFRYPIIPQADGKFVIPAVGIAFFDPAAKAYRTVSTERYECTATGCVRNTSVVEATGLKVLGSDINHIKPDAAARRMHPAVPSRWLWAVYVLSFGLIGGSFWLRGYRDRLASDRGFARRARSSGLVRRRLKASAALLRNHDLPGFYAALTQAVAGYAGDRFDLDTQAMTKEQLRD
ncbi:MAG: BatD family protein, partial [Candidatus Edwardsbacteria bacterium]|nr:BatD family protein [Candidatus Edwardsbacteria bacterium]